MTCKIFFILAGLLLCMRPAQSQTSPLKLFTLKQESTNMPADSLGTTSFYSTSFEINSAFNLVSVLFDLKGSVSDSVINRQRFDLPPGDGVYELHGVPNALIRDGNHVYILLGNITSTEPLKLVTEFKDSDQVIYSGILTNQ